MKDTEKTDGGVTVGGLPSAAAVYTTFLCLLFGANVVAIKFTLAGMGSLTTAGLRFGMAACAIFLWTRFTRRNMEIARKHLSPLIVLGVLFFGQFSLFYLGMMKTTASHGALLANILPFIVMVLAHFFIVGDTITARKVVGLLFGFSGVAVLFADRVTLTEDVLQGDLMVLAAVFLWGINAVYSKRVIHNYTSAQISFYPMVIASPLLLIGGFLFDERMVRYIDMSVLLSFFYQTFVVASFGLVAWNSLVRRYGATALHSFVFVMPLAGVFFGVVLLHEPLTFHLLVSILLVTAGLVVVNRKTIPQL